MLNEPKNAALFSGPGMRAATEIMTSRFCMLGFEFAQWWAGGSPAFCSLSKSIVWPPAGTPTTLYSTGGMARERSGTVAQPARKHNGAVRSCTLEQWPHLLHADCETGGLPE